ncbi:MAG: LVIVD repeat-containing protein, partial [Candidatus Promineifilaceae bacterium]
MKRFWRSIAVLGIFLGLLLVACTPEEEQVPTSEPAAVESEATRPAPTAPAATTAPTVTTAPTATTPPTEPVVTKATATAEALPTATPEPAFESPGPLPNSQETTLNIVNQWGGTPQSITLEGTTAYVGFGPRLLAVDVSNPSRPGLLGQSDMLPDLVRGVDVAGGLAYLAAGQAGLVILDVSDPAAMRIVNDGPNYAGGQPANAHRVIVNGGVAFVVDYNRTNGQSALLHFDVSDPEQASLLDSQDLPSDASVQVTEGLIVVIGSRQMQLRDAAKPGFIMSVTPLAAGNYTSRAVIQGSIITVAECCAPTGIERFDVSDPYHPAALGPLQELEFMPPFHAAAEGPMLATANNFGEFGFCQSVVNLIDIADAAARQVGSFDPQNCLNDLALDGNQLYLAGRSGLQIYDLSDASNPLLLALFRHPDGFHDVQGLARRQGITYALNAEGRGFELTTLDLNQQPPGLVLNRQNIGQDILLDLFASGDTLIAPVWMGSLYTLDISDPAASPVLHRPVEGELYSGDIFTVATRDGVFYTSVVDGVLIGGIGAIDLSDPANPILASTVETSEPMILNLTLSGDTLYVLSQGERSRVALYDVSQPLAPEQLATLTMPEFVSRLAVVGDTLYAACDGHNCQSIYAI